LSQTARLAVASKIEPHHERRPIQPRPYTRAASLPKLLRDRILILDGAMGTMIQRYKLTEADYRGTRFADHRIDVKGNNELLLLTPRRSSRRSTSSTWPPAPT
jgi:hypothetical protein